MDCQPERKMNEGRIKTKEEWEKSSENGFNALCYSNLMPKLIHFSALWNEFFHFARIMLFVETIVESNIRAYIIFSLP